MRVQRRVLTGLLVGVMTFGSLSFLANPTANADVDGWNAGYIISDANMYTQGGMSEYQIQNFLNAKGRGCSGNSCLKNYRGNMASFPSNSYCKAVQGGYLTAAQMIYRVSKACNISAKVLLVTLEKENSLVSSPSWYNYSTGASGFRTAMGYGCPDNAACDAEYYGVGNQLYHAAWQFNSYRNNPYSFNFRGNSTAWIGYNPVTSCGGSYVYIKNAATAGLYNYTPYQPNPAAVRAGWGVGNSCSSYGNRNFYNIYKSWFGDPRSSSSSGENFSPQVVEKTVEWGQSGDAVGLLQSGLMDLYPSYSRFYVDSTFGAKTQAIVKYFQGKNGLPQTGKVDQETSIKLVDNGIPLAVIPPIWQKTNVEYGDGGKAIAALQLALATVGGTGFEHDIDSWFGNLTSKKLKEFQASKGLPRTGVVDLATSAKLVGLGVPLYVVPDISISRPLAYGSSGDAVLALQMYGKAKHPSWFPANPDGSFGAKTENLVKRLQASKGLSVTGIFDYETWSAINDSNFPVKMSKPIEAKPTILNSVMGLGDWNDNVTQVQRILAEHYPQYIDFDPDGGYGMRTERAIKSVQRANGIYPDGMVGEKTTAIFRKLGENIWYQPEITTSSVVKYGQWDDAVMALQVGLKVYFPESTPFTPDGGFGAKTEAAVKAAQAKLGLTQTGIVDEKTASELHKIGVPLIVKPAYFKPVITSTVLRNQSPMLWNDDVLYLQRAMEFFYPEALSYSPDGGFGNLTEASVKHVQQELGVPATGIYDAATSVAFAKHGIPVRVIPAATTNDNIGPGSHGDAVYTIQWAGLHFHPELPDFTPDGYYGVKTKAIIAAFQKDAGLPQTGVADRNTCNYLKSLGIPLYYK